MRKLSILLIFCAFCVSCYGATMQQMRFHCENDTTKINELLSAGRDSGLTNANELVTFYAHRLLGTPYVGHTLEGEQEWLTINIDELDCTTFVETLYALARTTMSGRYSWRDYAYHLENLRYRHGEMGDYSSRLHYISDWVIDNTSMGNIVEVTADIPEARHKVKTINFMTTHRSSYPALADSLQFERVKRFEMGYINHRYPYLSVSSMSHKAVKAALRNGDFIGIVTKIEGLDVSHLGIIEKDEKGEIYLLDASSVGKKVQLEKLNMANYLRRNKNNEGIRVFRIKE